MQFSVREAKAQFAHAATAAANGERVIITKHGKPFVEIIPAAPAAVGNDLWARLAVVREELGLSDVEGEYDDRWLAEFNDPAFSRRVLGLDD